MKKVAVLLLSLMLAFTGFACGGSGGASSDQGGSDDSGYPQMTITISTSGADTGIDTQAAKRFAEAVAAASDGKITANVFPQAQLVGGDQSKVAEALAAGGTFDMGILSGANLNSLSEQFQIHQLPFLFASYEEASAALDGGGGEYYASILDPKGVTYIGALHNGLRHWTNNIRPLTKPEDFKGLKMRIPAGEVGMAVFKTLGADPVTIPFSELYTSLQMGTADGQENGYQTAGAANLYEVQKYVTESAWQYDGWFVVANKAVWEGYNDATRELLAKHWKEAIQWARDTIETQDGEYKEKFIEAGCEVYVPTAEELQVFKDAVAPVTAQFVEKYGEEGCRAWGVID
jgi:tripartite ATP-independent transporter DctP family solute receptor